MDSGVRMVRRLTGPLVLVVEISPDECCASVVHVALGTLVVHFHMVGYSVAERLIAVAAFIVAVALA